MIDLTYDYDVKRNTRFQRPLPCTYTYDYRATHSLASVTSVTIDCSASASDKVGVWPSRDPINAHSFFSRIWSRETLPLNLVWEGSTYAYCDNDPIEAYDFLGLCRIWYNCTLVSAVGKCDKSCTYSCKEYQRGEPAFGPHTPCWEVPKPFKFSKQVTASGFKIRCFCLKKGKCKDSFKGVGTHGGGGIDCSKSGCKKGCDTIALLAEQACRISPSPVVCKALAKAAKLLCKAGCDACSNP